MSWPATGKKGKQGLFSKPYLVYTSNRNDNSDIYGRFYDGQAWSDDQPLVATSADEFDATVIVDAQNNAYMSWTSNQGGAGYTICFSPIRPGGEIAQRRLVRYDEDVMHARMAPDNKGGLWTTYYKWQRINGKSRDKEVYARYYDGKLWGKEMHISPDDVPEYEDHSEPAIACQGNMAVVCWSWDYHAPKGYKFEAETPTIFARRLMSTGQLSKVVAVSKKRIDMTPAVAFGD